MAAKFYKLYELVFETSLNSFSANLQQDSWEPDVWFFYPETDFFTLKPFQRSAALVNAAFGSSVTFDQMKLFRRCDFLPKCKIVENSADAGIIFLGKNRNWKLERICDTKMVYRSK